MQSDLAREMAAAGVPRIMFTDIGQDGMLTEPNYAAYGGGTGCPVVASGGVSKVSHLVSLRRHPGARVQSLARRSTRGPSPSVKRSTQ